MMEKSGNQLLYKGCTGILFFSELLMYVLATALQVWQHDAMESPPGRWQLSRKIRLRLES